MTLYICEGRVFVQISKNYLLYVADLEEIQGRKQQEVYQLVLAAVRMAKDPVRPVVH